MRFAASPGPSTALFFPESFGSFTTAVDEEDEAVEEEVHEAKAKVTMMENEVKSAEFKLGLAQVHLNINSFFI